MEDLFEYPDRLPSEVIQVLDTYAFAQSYSECDILIKKLNEVGYTCDYGLDASPYNLTKL